MRFMAYAFYLVAGALLVFVIWLAIALGAEYGWEWEFPGTLVWIVTDIVVVGLPLWVGTLFHRAARERERSRPVV